MGGGKGYVYNPPALIIRNEPKQVQPFSAEFLLANGMMFFIIATQQKRWERGWTNIFIGIK